MLEPRTVFDALRRGCWTSPIRTMPSSKSYCGKGTYVRAWVRDLALALGTLGHVSALRRTWPSGAFRPRTRSRWKR